MIQRGEKKTNKKTPEGGRWPDWHGQQLGKSRFIIKSRRPIWRVVFSHKTAALLCARLKAILLRRAFIY